MRHKALLIVDIFLFEGKIFKAGVAENLVEDEGVRKIYLGEKFKLEKYE